MDSVGDARANSGELPESEADERGGVGMDERPATAGLPWAASMRTTDSQLCSRERTRSLSSSFSRSLVLSVNCEMIIELVVRKHVLGCDEAVTGLTVGTTCGAGWCFERYSESSSLSWRFSSSSSETRPFSWLN